MPDSTGPEVSTVPATCRFRFRERPTVSDLAAEFAVSGFGMLVLKSCSWRRTPSVIAFALVACSPLRACQIGDELRSDDPSGTTRSASNSDRRGTYLTAAKGCHVYLDDLRSGWIAGEETWLLWMFNPLAREVEHTRERVCDCGAHL